MAVGFVGFVQFMGSIGCGDLVSDEMGGARWGKGCWVLDLGLLGSTYGLVTPSRGHTI